MSIQAINWALNIVTNITSTQKAILIALADRANEDGECWPSYDDICARSCATRNTVYASLVKMQKLGLLTKTRRFSKSTIYKLHISTHSGDISSKNFGYISSTNFADMDSTNIDTLTINEPPKESSWSKRFDEFWSKYPKKVAKPKAEKAFKNLSVKDQKAALAGLSGYAFSSDKQYIPNPTTWLNQRRWEDEQESDTGAFEI